MPDIIKVVSTKNNSSLCFIARIKQLLHFNHFSILTFPTNAHGMQSLQKKFQIKFYLFIKDYSTGLITKIAAGAPKKPTQRKIDIVISISIASMLSNQ